MSEISFATVIWSRHAVALPSMGKRGRWMTWPFDGCEGGYSKRGTDAFYFWSELVRE